MKKTGNKLMSLLLALVMVFSCVTPVLAEGSTDFDNSTTLADGEYTGSEVEFTWSGSSGKITMTLNKVVVADGKATAEFAVSSANLTHVYLGTAEGDGEITALYDPDTGAVGKDVYAFADKTVTIPVRLNEEVAFAMRTVAMSKPHWINYTYTITINTDPAETDADYTAVDAALAKVPADLSVYTDESVAALQAAVNAVERGLPASRQADVDAMAKAIEDAIAGLVRKPVDGRVDLEIINNTGMFKAAYAYLETADGQTNLVVALNGKSYENLFRGTYTEGLANGDNRENWIKYREGDGGKYEFVFPLADGESYIPVVSISNSYLTKYENGENPLERAFYPRQFELDREAKTLTVGDYDETITAAVKSNVEDFKAAETAQMRVVGGPNSNNYNVAPVLQMLDDTYDQVTYPTVVNGQIATATAELTADKTFAISLLNAPNKEAFRDKEPIDMQFRVKATGETVTYQVTIDLLAKTITIDGQAEEEAVYTFVSGGDGTWTKGSGKDFEIVVKRSVDDDTTFGHFQGITVDGKALDKANYEAVAGSVKITLKGAYLETLSAGKHTVAVTFDDASAETTLTVAEAGTSSPKTGDPGVMLWVAMAAASAAGAVVLKRKKDEDGE